MTPSYKQFLHYIRDVLRLLSLEAQFRNRERLLEYICPGHSLMDDFQIKL